MSEVGVNRGLFSHWITVIIWLVAGLAATPSSPAVAAGAVKVSKAAWSAKTGTLVVRGRAKDASTPVEIYDLNGRRLGVGQGGSFAMSLPKSALPTPPCGIRVKAGADQALVRVQGAPKSCRRPVACSITAPAAGLVLAANSDVNFSATVKGKGPVFPVTYEWDFAGGSMGEAIPGSNPPAFKRPAGKLNGNGAAATTVSFVRNDSTYRVRFIAKDVQGRRCEDSVEVAVGQPPTGLPAKVAEQPAAAFGSELDGAKGDVVVLPFEEWTYQNLSDMKYGGNGYGSFSPTVNNVRAYAFRKDRLPVFLTGNDVELRYSAASNPSDPAGADSINSTSRNYPVAAAFKDAALKKTDAWEILSRPDSEKSANYFACSWMMTGYWTAYGCGDAQGAPAADEGYFKAKKDQAGNVLPDDPNTDNGHGAFMPGKDGPYAANAPQPFSKFVATTQSGGTDKPAAWFAANMLPLTDTDDQGRANPYPLLRVEAAAKGTGNVLAKTDGVVSASRDFHCRECHAKGKVAANPDAPHTQAAFGSSAFGKVALQLGKKGGPDDRYYIDDDKKPAKPAFFSVADIGGDPNSIHDQEYAAALNYSSIHQFYDVIPFFNDMRYGIGRTYLTDAQKANPAGLVDKDTPRPCYGCHATALSFTPFGNAWWDEEGRDVKDPAYAPNYSIAMHRMHGEFQWKDEAHTDIVRDEKGAFVRFDWKTNGQHNSTKTRSLFPIFDGNGSQLPMEENCLRCHSGHREQQFRDRMYTAGVTCYDCHGDMLAMGEAFPKNYLANKAKVGSINRDDYRVPWYDEPDCGSCHMGNGNRGADKSGGYFSAGVMKRAFDEADFSATTRAVDKGDPDSRRFSAAPLENYKASFPTDYYADWDAVKEEFTTEKLTTKIDAPLFREGKDRHGNVACAACHGAAHSVWPNGDPSANDNITALQLQGHTGTVLECNVCHSSDSFAKFEDLDGGVNYSGDAKAGILGGPHDMHPVNDPYWWKEAPGDSPNTDGTTVGGWHNNYAKIGGLKDEDQCAACHGSDHKGTRLSKTPVDRVFDFRGFDFGKLKKAGFKSKIVKVAAGTQIGCDTCHSLELSKTGSPGKAADQVEARLQP